MARIGPMNVTDGNNTYQFVVYDLEGPAYNAPGVYIFSKGIPNAQGGNDHHLLYIGETEDLKDRLGPSHHKWNEALSHGMNYISVYFPYPVESRSNIERHLIQHIKPPLNDQTL
ncbi:hypothetical protein C6497_07485 [Candidatus Poribacteria bacterium]|nr:MAG: hypothetical protein C6497_07485 [Candidatus Poribacteria bacterium]